MTLRQLLDQSAVHDAEYGHNLASHLPMALVALHRLGADDARLAEFAARYASRLHPAPAPEPWPPGDPWQARLGDPAAWPAYRQLFDEWFDHEGAPSVLPQVLPALMRGVGAAAFHGPIRVAYALAASHSHELSDALAYWACRWFELGPLPTNAKGNAMGKDAKAALARLAVPKPARPLIAERMVMAATHPSFWTSAAALRVQAASEEAAARSLRQWAELAARLYAATGNFTALHLTTSAHAVRVLLPWLDEPALADAMGHYWLAYVAGCAASGVEMAAPLPPPGAPKPWPTIVERAIASDDDHLIKIVDCCREQERAYGGSVWQSAASRALGAD